MKTKRTLEERLADLIEAIKEIELLKEALAQEIISKFN